jgi:hypothetical protein
MDDFDKSIASYGNAVHDTPENAYKRLAGEVEARNVQTRKDMSIQERRASEPSTTEDVPRSQQIVRGSADPRLLAATALGTGAYLSKDDVIGGLDIAGGMAHGLGIDMVKGLTGLGGLLMGRGLDRSLTNANALAGKIPEYNIGREGGQVIGQGIDAYDQSPEMVKQLLKEYMRAGDYWGEKGGEIHPLLGTALKVGFDAI